MLKQYGQSYYVVWATYDGGVEKLAVAVYCNKPRADAVVDALNHGRDVRTRRGMLRPEEGAIYTAEHEMSPKRDLHTL